MLILKGSHFLKVSDQVLHSGCVFTSTEILAPVGTLFDKPRHVVFHSSDVSSPMIGFWPVTGNDTNFIKVL